MVWTLCPSERKRNKYEEGDMSTTTKTYNCTHKIILSFFVVKSNTFPYHTHLIQDMSSTTSYNMKKRTDEKKPKAPGTNIRQAFCQVTKIWDSSHPASANDQRRGLMLCLQHIGTIVREFLLISEIWPSDIPSLPLCFVQIFSKGAPYHDPHLVAGC